MTKTVLPKSFKIMCETCKALVSNFAVYTWRQLKSWQMSKN